MKIYAKTKKSAGDTIQVKEEFVPYGTKQLDSKDRITLGGKLKKIINSKMDVEGFQVFLGSDGDVLLRPTVAIPSKEAWVYQNPEVIGEIRKGMQQAKEGKTIKAGNLEDYLKKL